MASHYTRGYTVIQKGASAHLIGMFFEDDMEDL